MHNILSQFATNRTDETKGQTGALSSFEANLKSIMNLPRNVNEVHAQDYQSNRRNELLNKEYIKPERDHEDSKDTSIQIRCANKEYLRLKIGCWIIEFRHAHRPHICPVWQLLCIPKRHRFLPLGIRFLLLPLLFYFLSFFSSLVAGLFFRWPRCPLSVVSLAQQKIIDL